MAKRDEPRGLPLNRGDQAALVAVATGIVLVTGLLVGLLF